MLSCAAPDLDQRADHGAHLTVQEGSRRGSGSRSPRPRASREIASSVFTGVSAWHWLSRKVVKSWRPTSACAASCIACGIELLRNAPCATAIERKVRPAIEDAIEIGAAGGVEAGVEIRRGLFCGKHRHGMRPQVGVQRIAHLVRRAAPSAGRDGRPVPAHGRRRPSGRRRSPARARHRAPRRLPPAPAAPTARRPGAASRRTRRRHIPASACI